MSNIKRKLGTVPLLVAVCLLGGAIAGYTSIAGAEGTTTDNAEAGFMMNREPHVDGVITAINGASVTIDAEANHGGGSYVIDATNASVTKDGTASSLASFAVGDKIWAEGTISGTNVTATKISNDREHGFGFGRGKDHGVMGTVSAVEGNTITLTGKDGQTYTIEASSSKVTRMVEGALSDVQVGDNIGVAGTVSGTNVTATNIMDDLPQP